MNIQQNEVAVTSDTQQVMNKRAQLAQRSPLWFVAVYALVMLMRMYAGYQSLSPLGLMIAFVIGFFVVCRSIRGWSYVLDKKYQKSTPYMDRYGDPQLLISNDGSRHTIVRELLEKQRSIKQLMIAAYKLLFRSIPGLLIAAVAVSLAMIPIFFFGWLVFSFIGISIADPMASLNIGELLTQRNTVMIAVVGVIFSFIVIFVVALASSSVFNYLVAFVQKKESTLQSFVSSRIALRLIAVNVVMFLLLLLCGIPFVVSVVVLTNFDISTIQSFLFSDVSSGVGSIWALFINIAVMLIAVASFVCGILLYYYFIAATYLVYMYKDAPTQPSVKAYFHMSKELVAAHGWGSTLRKILLTWLVIGLIYVAFSIVMGLITAGFTDGSDATGFIPSLLMGILAIVDVLINLWSVFVVFALSLFVHERYMKKHSVTDESMSDKIASDASVANQEVMDVLP